MTTIPITKLDAARRQIEVAIMLWFDDADCVSVHTLAAAALGILNDLGTPKGIMAMTFDPAHYRKETFAEWRRIAKASQNFFKHADKDPAAVLDFCPDSNKYEIWDCVDTYHRLTTERTPVMRVFTNYFTIHHPQYFKSIISNHAALLDLKELSKKQFFREALPETQRCNTHV